MNCISPLENNNYFGASITAVAVSNRQSLDLAITTAEGDQVALSSIASNTAAYGTYEGMGTAQASCFEITRESSLSVEGDLSKAESKDIAKAIHTYGKVIKDTLSGRAQPAAAHARKLTRLDEISSLEGTFSSQQSFSAEILSIEITA